MLQPPKPPSQHIGRGVRGELARGGRYITESGEAATGVSLYMDTILRALPEATPVSRLYLPTGTAFSVGQAQRADGWITVAALGDVQDAAAEATRLACSHILINDKPVAVDGTDS